MFLHYIESQVQELLSTVVIRLLNDEHIRNQGLDYLMWLLVQPGTKAALVTLLKDTFADPYFQVFRPLVDRPLLQCISHLLLVQEAFKPYIQG